MSKHNLNSGTFFGYFFAALTIFFWGITFVCTKALLGKFSALEILFVRFIFAYIGLWLIRPKYEKISLKDNLWFALAGLTGVTMYQFAENVAINYTSASNVSVIVSICPMFTAIISQIFFKEKHITPFFVIGFVISIIGVSLVSLNGKTQLSLNPAGDLLALLASVCWGFYSLAITVINKKTYSQVGGTRRIYFFAIVFMLPLILIGSFKQPGHFMNINWNLADNAARFSDPAACLSLLFLGLIASAFCFVAWNKVCNTLGTVKITSGLYLIPVVTIIFAAVFIGEKITVMGACGAVITIAGLFISGIKAK